MKAIATKYSGVQFRSRLEAKWAAFFDLVGWQWEYEPCDFDGWIPDFVLIGKNAPVYVEIKPLTPEEGAGDVITEIDASGCDKECLILGIGVQKPEEFGWMREGFNFETGDGMQWWWQKAAFGKWDCGTYGFCAVDGSFNDRISGTYDGGSYGGDYVAEKDFLNLIREAGNRTQWKGLHA